MRIAVGIATLGRARLLKETLLELRTQSRPPDRAIVSAAGTDDVAGIDPEDWGVELLFGPKGLPAQRNRILDRVDDCDVLLYLDDDFFPAADYLLNLERVFREKPDVVVATGRVIADGVVGPGLGLAEARGILAGDRAPDDVLTVEPTWHGYGCNMAVRLSAVRALNLRFDENLPLYGWLEDADFTWQLREAGRVVRAAGLRGVHLGVKQARSPGVRLGYSQVVNPIYLCRKGTYSLRLAIPMIARQFAKNLVRSPYPEPYVDRFGRLRGNLLACIDLMKGCADPRRILDL